MHSAADRADLRIGDQIVMADGLGKGESDDCQQVVGFWSGANQKDGVVWQVFRAKGNDMKVQIYETVSVDVETTIDVNVNDVLMEFSRRIESAEMNGELPLRNTFLPLVDFATNLMAKIPERGIATCKDSQREEVIRRLQTELDRWNAIMVDAEL